MHTPRMIILTTILTLSAIGQIVLTFLFYDSDGNEVVRNIGWIILAISALFGWLPIYTFKKWGGVAKGESYMKTTMLVDRGVYRIVRHPQYLAGILMGIALAMIGQHWIIAVIGVIYVVTTYTSTWDEEKLLINKFGDEYRQYMRQVPRVNFIFGIIRSLRR